MTNCKLWLVIKINLINVEVYIGYSLLGKFRREAHVSRKYKTSTRCVLEK